MKQPGIVTRREFLRISGLMAAATAMAGCATGQSPTPESQTTASPATEPALSSSALRVWMENAFLPEIDAQNEKVFKEWGQKNNVEVEFTAAAIAAYRE